MAKRTKFTLYYYIQDNGDGSASPLFFTTKKKRDAYMNAEYDSGMGETFCDADGEITLMIDENGTLSPTPKDEKFAKQIGEDYLTLDRVWKP